METKQIMILSDNFVTNSMFDYLTDAEKQQIKENVKNKRGIIFGVLENGIVNGAVILEFHGDEIRIVHTGGKFLKYLGYFDTFILALSRFYCKRKITMCSFHRAVIKRIKKFNFIEIEPNEFQKVV